MQLIDERTYTRTIMLSGRKPALPIYALSALPSEKTIDSCCGRWRGEYYVKLTRLGFVGISEKNHNVEKNIEVDRG